jgi:hypothetical protein
MDPWLEDCWPGFHLHLISIISSKLGRQLPDDLLVTAEETISIGDADDKIRPDLNVSEESWKTGVPPSWSPEREDVLESTVTKPLLVMVPPVKHRWLEILTTTGHLVTVIEIISPTNKMGGREFYRNKRKALVKARVNVVEMDLLRGGHTLVDVDGEWWDKYTSTHRPDYVTCVSRGQVDEQREVYPSLLRDRLPVIRVPLRPGEADIILDIQEAVNEAYDMGLYWKRDHRHEPSLALNPDDSQWADALLRENGLRS